MVRFYRSSWNSGRPGIPTGLGQAWNHNHATQLQLGATSQTAAIIAPEGHQRTFSKLPSSAAWIADNSADSLTATPSGWTYKRADDDSLLSFDSSGRLQTNTRRDGFVTTYRYDGLGRLATVSNGFGRTLSLGYDSAGRLSAVTTPDGRTIGYSYDTMGRLAFVTYPDGKSRGYLYENGSFPHALTGIVDESGVRWGTFGYDSEGRATSTQLAGGAERYEVFYPYSGSASVRDPLGTQRTYVYGSNKNKLAVAGASLPSASRANDAASRVQDANGLITSETDFKGSVTTTAWDVARRLPLSVTRAAGTPEAQTVTTQWHPSFSLPVLVTETGRTTGYTYDSKGNVLSQTITDTATSRGSTRTWKWTWNARGLAATETAPNGAVTSFEYDSRGNLVKSTNALGHVTRYAYDNANRIVGSTDPNGLVATYTYDARDRLLARTVGGQGTTTLSYQPTGRVDTLTLHTGLSFTYTYDAAHRLTGWRNSRGESGSYTLDGMGNRVAEQIRNPAGAIAWSTVRTINSLNRLAARTEGSNQTSAFAYDANGELVSHTNGLNQSTRYGLDPLRRISTITDAANAVAGLTWNALDAVVAASDFKGALTAYGRDALGNPATEASPDIGSKTTQYDALGLPSQIVDALGQATRIQRDLLGRPVQIAYADGKTTSLVYDGPNAKG